MQTQKQTSYQTGTTDPKIMAQKSIVVLDIKPEGTETDLSALKKDITQKIKMDGLAWGESRQEEIAYGIKKLVLGCCIQGKVSIEEIIQKIEGMKEVQAVDIASFNKV